MKDANVMSSRTLFLICLVVLLFEVSTAETVTAPKNCSNQLLNLCFSHEYDITKPATEPLFVKANVLIEVLYIYLSNGCILYLLPPCQAQQFNETY